MKSTVLSAVYCRMSAERLADGAVSELERRGHKEELVEPWSVGKVMGIEYDRASRRLEAPWPTP